MFLVYIVDHSTLRSRTFICASVRTTVIHGVYNVATTELLSSVQGFTICYAVRRQSPRSHVDRIGYMGLYKDYAQAVLITTLQLVIKKIKWLNNRKTRNKE